MTLWGYDILVLTGNIHACFADGIELWSRIPSNNIAGLFANHGPTLWHTLHLQYMLK